jgi:hypothetical protein
MSGAEPKGSVNTAGRSLCLVVHDDLELRLQAAALLRLHHRQFGRG